MYMENLEYIEDKSYRVAEPLLQGIKDMLKSLGMDSGHVDRWESLIYLVLILLLSLVITWLLRIVLHRVFVRLSRHTRNKTLQIMIKRRLFFECRLYLFPAYRIGFSAVGIWRCTSLDKVDRADMQYCICRCVLVLYQSHDRYVLAYIFSAR